MSNSNKGGALVSLLWILTIIFTIVAGIISWNVVEPNRFMEFIGFLLIWGVLSSVGHFLAIGLTAMIERMS